MGQIFYFHRTFFIFFCTATSDYFPGHALPAVSVWTLWHRVKRNLAPGRTRLTFSLSHSLAPLYVCVCVYVRSVEGGSPSGLLTGFSFFDSRRGTLIDTQHTPSEEKQKNTLEVRETPSPQQNFSTIQRCRLLQLQLPLA